MTEHTGMTDAAVRTGQGALYHCDAGAFLRSLPDASANLIVADPPYNLSKAKWDTFESQASYVDWSLRWIREAHRALHPDGTLYVCGFSEILADVKWVASDLFEGCRWLVWYYRNKGNLGSDWGRSHESILHLRKSRRFTFNVDDVRVPYNQHTVKYPSHPQAESSQYGGGRKPGKAWEPHPGGAKPRDVMEIPTLCNGSGEKTTHPTQKPLELIVRLVLASSDPGDLVVDPFVGSGTTAVAAEFLGRRWFASELDGDYVAMAAERVSSGRDEERLRALIANPDHTAANRRNLRGDASA